MIGFARRAIHPYNINAGHRPRPFANGARDGDSRIGLAARFCGSEQRFELVTR